MRKETYEAMVAWGTVVTAVGVLFAAAQVVLIGRQVQDAAQQTIHTSRQVEIAVEQTSLIKQVIQNYYELSRRYTAYQALTDWSRSQPPNAARCVELLANLDQTQFNAAVDRVEVSIPPNLQEGVLRCFSDKDIAEIKTLFDEGRLTRKGASLLVERVRNALNSDENVTRLVKYGIGDKEMIDEGVSNAVSTEDKKIIDKLDAKLGRNTFPPLREYLEKIMPRAEPKPPLK